MDNTQMMAIDETPRWKAFLFHLATSTFAVLAVTVIVSLTMEGLGVDARTAQALTFGPTFLLPLCTGFCIGYLFGLTYYNKAVPYVWVVPLAFLTFVLVGTLLHAPWRGGSSRVEVLFDLFGPLSRGTDDGLEQVFYTAPCVCAIAYAIGGSVRRRWSRSTSSS